MMALRIMDVRSESEHIQGYSLNLFNLIKTTPIPCLYKENNNRKAMSQKVWNTTWHDVPPDLDEEILHLAST